MWKTPEGEAGLDHLYRLEERVDTHLQRMFEFQAKRDFLDLAEQNFAKPIALHEMIPVTDLMEQDDQESQQILEGLAKSSKQAHRMHRRRLHLGEPGGGSDEPH